jgi:hypothetical protein
MLALKVQSQLLNRRVFLVYRVLYQLLAGLSRSDILPLHITGDLVVCYTDYKCQVHSRRRRGGRPVSTHVAPFLSEWQEKL